MFNKNQTTYMMLFINKTSYKVTDIQRKLFIGVTSKIKIYSANISQIFQLFQRLTIKRRLILISPLLYNSKKWCLSKNDLCILAGCFIIKFTDSQNVQNMFA